MFPRLYPIADTVVAGRAGLSPVLIAEALLEAGVKIMQFRHKGAYTRDRLAEAQTIAELCASAGAMYVINDRADIAALLHAGLHLGQDDLPLELARRILTEGPIGLSTHNAVQFAAATARARTLDYIALGPIYATGSKENPDPVVGVEELRRIAAGKRVSLVAIGGITLQRAHAVLEAGADSIAVISALIPCGVATKAIIRDIASEWQAAVML